MCYNKIFLILLCSLAFASCKKDGAGSNSGKLMLSKVIEEGKLANEYIYAADGKLLRTNWYNSNSGQPKLSTHFTYEYNDNGTRKQDMQYNGYTGVVRRVFTYDAEGKVSRIDVAVKNSTNDNIDDFDYFEVYEYNNKGQLAKVTRRETDQTLVLRRQYSYDDKGNLVHRQLHVFDDGQLEIRENDEIVPGAKQMPDHWKKLLIDPDDMDLNQFFAAGRTLTDYWIITTGRTSNYNYLSRVRNNQGIVTSETIQLMRNGVEIIAVDRNYEYVEVKSF